MISRSIMSNIFASKISIVNARLFSNQNINLEGVKKIENLHKVRNCYLTLMENTDDITNLKKLSKIIEQIDFQLQKLWKFKVDSKYHRFWNLPKCQCPKLDNMDALGTGRKIYSKNCPIHG